MKNTNIISREMILSKMTTMDHTLMRTKVFMFSRHLFNKHIAHTCEEFIDDIPDNDLKEFYLHLHKKE